MTNAGRVAAAGPVTLVDLSGSVVVASGSSVFAASPATVGALAALITLSVISGTAPTLQFAIDALDLHGNYVQVGIGAALAGAGNQLITVNPFISSGGRLRWIAAGTVFTSATFTASVLGR